MSYHRYDVPPEPRPHETWQTSTGYAIAIGLLMVVLVGAGMVGLTVGVLLKWLLGL